MPQQQAHWASNRIGTDAETDSQTNKQKIVWKRKKRLRWCGGEAHHQKVEEEKMSSSEGGGEAKPTTAASKSSVPVRPSIHSFIAISPGHLHNHQSPCPQPRCRSRQFLGHSPFIQSPRLMNGTKGGGGRGIGMEIDGHSKTKKCKKRKKTEFV